MEIKRHASIFALYKGIKLTLGQATEKMNTGLKLEPLNVSTFKHGDGGMSNIAKLKIPGLASEHNSK